MKTFTDERAAFAEGVRWALTQLGCVGAQEEAPRGPRADAIAREVSARYPDPKEQAKAAIVALEKKYGEDAVGRALREMGF